MKWLTYNNPHYFRFWCYKVLPLVYDDSLSYYEVLCKVVKYLGDLIEDIDRMKENIQSLRDAFDELKFYVDNYFDNLDIQEYVNNFMESLIESGELGDILNAAINGSLVDVSYYKPFAQILPQSQRLFDVGLYAQGFAIGEVNNRPIALTCFTDGTTEGSTNVFSLDYFDTGANISKVNVASGHCNGACFNETDGNFYVVTGGITGAPNNIIVYSTSGSVINTIAFGYPAWAIAWNRDKFYIAIDGGRVLVTDNNLNVLSTVNIAINGDKYTYQGMYADDKYLYFPNGNNRTTTTADRAARNRLSVFLHNGELYKHIEVMIPIEVEGLAIYNDRCYMNCNTQNTSLIFESDLYTKTADCYLGLPSIDNIVDYVQTMYIDETYAGFYVNGDSGSPLSSLYWYYMFIKPNVTRVNINLMSDAESKVFAMFGGCKPYIQLNGNNHKIKRINWGGNNIFGLRDIVIVGENNAISCHVTATRFIMSNVVFGEASSTIVPSRCLDVIGSPMEIISVTFNQSSSVSMYLIGSGYLRQLTVNIDHLNGIFMGGVFDVDESFPISKVQVSNNYGLSYQIKCRLMENIDIGTLFYPMVIDVRPGSYTITGLPTGVSSDSVTSIIVNAITQNKALLQIITTDGDVYNVLNTRVL